MPLLLFPSLQFLFIFLSCLKAWCGWQKWHRVLAWQIVEWLVQIPSISRRLPWSTCYHIHTYQWDLLLCSLFLCSYPKRIQNQFTNMISMYMEVSASTLYCELLENRGQISTVFIALTILYLIHILPSCRKSIRQLSEFQVVAKYSFRWEEYMTMFIVRCRDINFWGCLTCNRNYLQSMLVVKPNPTGLFWKQVPDHKRHTIQTEAIAKSHCLLWLTWMVLSPKLIMESAWESGFPVSRSSALPNPAIRGSAFLNTPGFVDAEVGLAEGNGFLYWNTG